MGFLGFERHVPSITAVSGESCEAIATCRRECPKPFKTASTVCIHRINDRGISQILQMQLLRVL